MHRPACMDLSSLEIDQPLVVKVCIGLIFARLGAADNIVASCAGDGTICVKDVASGTSEVFRYAMLACLPGVLGFPYAISGLAATVLLHCWHLSVMLTSLTCRRHQDRVKKFVTEPGNPNLMISCGEDGLGKHLILGCHIKLACCAGCLSLSAMVTLILRLQSLLHTPFQQDLHAYKLCYPALGCDTSSWHGRACISHLTDS